MAKKLLRFRGGFRPRSIGGLFRQAAKVGKQATKVMAAMEAGAHLGGVVWSKISSLPGNVRGAFDAGRGTGSTYSPAKVPRLKSGKASSANHEVSMSQEGTGVTTKTFFTSRFGHKRKVLSTVLKSASKATLHMNAIGGVGGVTGNQQYIGDMYQAFSGSTGTPFNVCAMFHGQQGTSSGVTGSPEGAIMAMYQQYPNVSSTSNLYVRSMHAVNTFQNRMAHNIFMDIYEVVAKHDHNIDQICNSQNVVAPSQYWLGGLNLNTGASGSVYNAISLSQNSTDMKPWESEYFNLYWKIVGTAHVELGAGGTHVHTSDYIVNCPMEYQRCITTPLMQGLTRNIMIVLKGIPVYNTAGAGSYNVSGAEVVWSSDMTYHSSMIEGNKSIDSYVDNRPSASSSTTEVFIETSTRVTGDTPA